MGSGARASPEHSLSHPQPHTHRRSAAKRKGAVSHKPRSPVKRQVLNLCYVFVSIGVHMPCHCMKVRTAWVPVLALCRVWDRVFCWLLRVPGYLAHKIPGSLRLPSHHGTLRVRPCTTVPSVAYVLGAGLRSSHSTASPLPSDSSLQLAHF